MLKPILPLPDHLRGNEAGTFTEDSVVRRLPEIARKTIEDNDLDPHRRERVAELADEIGHGVIVRVDEPEAPDLMDWQRYVDRYEGQRWVDVPWFFAETYFYRRLLAATGYSHPGPRRGVDPFTVQKEQALAGSLDLAAELGDRLDDIATLLGASLWANRVDLSLWRAGVDTGARATAAVGYDESRLLVDDSAAAIRYLERDELNLHVILDNSGAELIADLAVAAHVLERHGKVTIHVKPHPTFVSDVTLPDLEETVETLSAEKTAAKRIATAIRNAGNAVQLATHPFWVSPLPFWECPESVVDHLSDADLVVVKGDANYRRLLGDLHWDPTTPFDEIVRPLQPLVALRTTKALVAAGIAAEVVEHASTTDPDWLTNGEWGVIQFVPEVG